MHTRPGIVGGFVLAEPHTDLDDHLAAAKTRDTELAAPCGCAANRGFTIGTAESYAVLALAIRPRVEIPDEIADLDAAHRDMRRVEAVFADRFGACAQSRLGVRGGTVVTPAAAGSGFDGLVADLAADPHVEVTTTVVFADSTQIAQSVDRAHELLDVALRLRLRPGLYGFDDLALEYQLTRPGPGRDHLEAKLAPLGAHEELWTTLACYMANDYKRRCTARALNVHPNTVDNRLKRIAKLTGLDPMQPEGAWCLRSALVIRAYRDGAVPPPPLARSGHPMNTAVAS